MPALEGKAMRGTKTASAFLPGAHVVAVLLFIGLVTTNPLETVGGACSVMTSSVDEEDAHMVLPWCFGDPDEDDQGDDVDDESLRA